MMIKALGKGSNHVVKRAFPLNIDHIYAIVSYLDSARNVPLCIKPCILIGYSCYLRSSNLVAPNFVVAGGYHTLLTKHITDLGDKLSVRICSTKTKTVPYSLLIHALDCPRLCPVTAWRSYVARVNPPMNGPAFLLNHAVPLTSTLVVRLIKDALSGYEDVELSAISMHSLRRGAAQQATRDGASLPQVMERGGWASRSGVKPYLIQ